MNSLSTASLLLLLKVRRQQQTATLKIGLARRANPSILYRSSEGKGLQMKALTTHLKCMQLVKYHILKYSVNEETNYVWAYVI